MSKAPLGFIALPLVLAVGLPMLGCGGGAEVETASAESATESALDDGSTASDGEGGEPETGAAVWTCELYDRIKEEGTDGYDGVLTEEAEAYVAAAVRASLAENGVEPSGGDLEYLNRIRIELSDVCADNPEAQLAAAAAQIVASWEGEDEP